MSQTVKEVVIIGGGFAGLNAAKVLGSVSGVSVTLVDTRNHHLFQPLLYQVAMAGLNPSDISAPIRGLLSRHRNVRVMMDEAVSVDLPQRQVHLRSAGSLPFDYLIIATGALHSYFGNEEWELHAPGLKTIEQATEIRRRILTAFEDAEMCGECGDRERLLSFVVVGAGPTGVELAGAIAEMGQFTLARDFRRVDPRMSRVILIEAGPRILPAFDPELSASAMRSLEQLGVEVKTSCRVTSIDDGGVQAGDLFIPTRTVLWAAGVAASELGRTLGVPLDRQGRVLVEPDLSIDKFPYAFVVGDLAHYPGPDGQPLPGLAPVAMQQGRAAARNILRDLSGEERKLFHHLDKGMLATIGKNKAVGQFQKLHFTGFTAWIAWLFVHIYYLTGFANRLLVVIQWGWSYMTFKRGARLITGRDWRLYKKRRND
ncbi:NAD(P)/FAD-dependent oxidoreductase [Geomesophilobacter sediminis]|uniref:NADH:ubiquinone reductase (non-electrogenic) n=1 Tax=Geomesophilobacter sediminis TaxID=2798584 RepID=A0A8J7JF35_9BACT|nr:NAD(P)/FAD-dependent oxidoreductase [Geomesophilobacter sediminis]MBJ6726006.1 NAD(P)/FAD-dependent oxidoreductase [Geomesophilobacter sediminis]